MKIRAAIFCLCLVLIVSVGCIFPIEYHIVDDEVVTDCWGNIIPCVDNTYDLGQVSKIWHHGYVHELNSDSVITDSIDTDRIYNDDLLIDTFEDYYYITISDFYSWVSSTTGSGSVLARPSRATVFTGITPNSTAIRYAEIAPVSYGNAPAQVNWDNRFVWIFSVVKINNDAEFVGRIQIKEVVTEGQLAVEGLGIQVDNLSLTGESYGTGGRGTVNLLTVLNSSFCYGVKIELIPATRVDYYIDSGSGWDLKGTINDPTLIPQGWASGWDYLVISGKNGITGGVNNEFSIYKPHVWSMR
jgi:hypothetical protein